MNESPVPPEDMEEEETDSPIYSQNLQNPEVFTVNEKGTESFGNPESSTRAKKYYVSDVQVTVAAERIQYFDSNYCISPNNVDLFFSLNLFKNLKLDELGKGIKPGLNRNEAYIVIIPLPPLSEQKRIVAKIDELMALCDKLENQINQAAAKQTALFDAVLATV